MFIKKDDLPGMKRADRPFLFRALYLLDLRIQLLHILVHFIGRLEHHE